MMRGLLLLVVLSLFGFDFDTTGSRKGPAADDEPTI